jgi:hypothetical protein
MNKWYTVKVKYNKKSEDGQEPKKANEAFLLPAVSFTDAEARINKEIGQTAAGEFLVHAMSVTEITEIMRNEEGGQWYLGGITISEEDDNGKVHKTKQNYMIEAMSIKDATTSLENELEDAMFDFETTKVAVTTIVDVFYENLDVEISRTSVEETV